MQQTSWTADELDAMPVVEVDARHNGERYELKVDNSLGRVWVSGFGHVTYERWINGELRTLDESRQPFASLG